MTKPKKRLSPKGLQRKLTEKFSRMVRERDADEPCVSCRRHIEKKKAALVMVGMEAAK